MRRFLLLVALMFVALSSFGQNSGSLKFLGIPVDGKKADMIRELQQRGFEYDRDNDVLVGEFNGNRSTVNISTYHGVVDRVLVCDMNTVNVSQIRIAFNNLCYQFGNTGKYFSVDDPLIPADEDIRAGMSLDHKQYSAAFYPIADIPESMLKRLDAVLGKGGEKAQKEYEDVIREVLAQVKGIVWFAIFEYGPEYYIGIFYDNLVNRPHGEDL